MVQGLKYTSIPQHSETTIRFTYSTILQTYTEEQQKLYIWNANVCVLSRYEGVSTYI